MQRGRITSSALLVLVSVLILAGAAQALEVGQKAPDFTLPSADGRQIKLSELTAKGPVAIYTFIQAFTGT
jgi:thioredoxin-dependent peroxiredoxin